MEDYQIVATTRIIEKILLSHNVDILEVEEAFHNWEGIPLMDTRLEHKTRPPTIWFCSATDDGRVLKIVGIPIKANKEFVLKSAYDASSLEIDIYEENQ